MLNRIAALAVALTCCAAAFGDYVLDREAAVKLTRARKYKEAQAAFMKMAQGKKVTDFQKSDALEQAALCAAALKKYDEAIKIAKTIPLKPVSKTTQMQIMSRSRKWKQVVDQFKGEDIDSWPDDLKVKAYWARGASAYRVKNGKLAESDLSKAAVFPMSSNDKGLLLNNLGDTYRYLLKDDKKAIETYQRVFKESHIYKASHAAISMAGIYLKEGKPAEALKTLNRINTKKMRGYWASAVIAARARVLAAQGKTAEAIAAYKEALAIKGIPGYTKKTCEKALKKLTGEAK